MAIRPILHYPDPRLRTKAAPVADVGPEIRELIEDLAETMYAAPGVGLAAPQVDVPLRVFVVDIAAADEPSSLHVFVNPEIVRREGTLSWQEGCLSFPTVAEEIERAAAVTVRARDADGQPFELQADGLLAVAIQHEHDHLDGVLMVDHIGPLKRRIVHRKMMKRQRGGS
ncbi:MAG: peptide deformylase [Deltaproteobacteria bacterium]|nr:peptide deformylase [Deltaproteobacteria bacterium]